MCLIKAATAAAISGTGPAPGTSGAAKGMSFVRRSSRLFKMPPPWLFVSNRKEPKQSVEFLGTQPDTGDNAGGCRNCIEYGCKLGLGVTILYRHYPAVIQVS